MLDFNGENRIKTHNYKCAGSVLHGLHLHFLTRGAVSLQVFFFAHELQINYQALQCSHMLTLLLRLQLLLAGEREPLGLREHVVRTFICVFRCRINLLIYTVGSVCRLCSLFICKTCQEQQEYANSAQKSQTFKSYTQCLSCESAAVLL